MSKIAPLAHPWVELAAGGMEDAALLRPASGSRLVFTVDFITPIVDDPYAFGAIAAANAMSDVYAMGGEPRAALVVCGFPSALLPVSVLEEILRGGRDKAAEAGCAIAGGHTMKDDELKYGLCVLGSLDGSRPLLQSGARAGDALVLTKPLGLGIASQAIKADALDASELAEVTALMTTLNKSAKDAALAAGAHAATDVTGFGLLGHLRNLLLASGLSARISRAAVPTLARTPELAGAGFVPGGSKNNLAAAAPHCTWGTEVTEVDRLILADAQTSGGLLLAVPAARVELLLRELRERGTPARAVIGEAVAGKPGHIEVAAA